MENNEEITPENSAPPPVKLTWTQRLAKFAPYLVGVLAFFIGLFLFLPVESFAKLGLQQLTSSGVNLELEDLRLSLWGKLSANSVKIPLSDASKPDGGGRFEIAEIKGKIHPLDFLLRDKLDANLEGTLLVFNKGDINIKIDALNIEAVVESIRGASRNFNGKIVIGATSLMVSYKNVPMLKEDVSVPFLQVNIKGKLQQGNLALETGDAMGKLINARIQGSISLVNQLDLNLTIRLKLSEEFFQKYQDANLRSLLKFARLLHDDDHIEFTVKGPVSAPAVVATEVPLPGATAPGATTPGATTPGAVPPGANTPGATTPGSTTPGSTPEGTHGGNPSNPNGGQPR